MKTVEVVRMEKNQDNDVIQPEVYEVSESMKLKKHNAVMENTLIEARYNLTVEEQRLVLSTIAMLDNVETAQSGFPMLKIPKKLIIETTGIHEKNYHQIKTALRRLMQRIIEIETIEEDGKRRFKLYQWFSKAEYKEGDSFIEVQFHPDLKPYLLELKQRFTKIPLKQVLQLRSKYAIRLYELLKRYEDTGFRTDYIPELREKLGVKEGEYERFFDFERRVLKPAIKEINEKTDLEVSYEKKKTGRKITHIEFEINSKNAKEGDTTQTTKSPSESIDIQGQKQELKNMSDLWETTIEILANKYNLSENDYNILISYTYAKYKTDTEQK
ncbi:MAG: replication initiation protein [Persephonella sp.]|nr:replication initiation protein [Persephonella sp.]